MEQDNLKIINGREIAENILGALKPSVEKLKAGGVIPKMAVVLVGDDPSSLSYIRQKQKAAEKLGLIVELHQLPTTISYEEFLAKLDQLDQSPQVHGIIIQKPIPGSDPREGLTLVNRVSPQKDIDGFREDSEFLPPVGEAVLEITNQLLQHLKSQNILILGRGETGGRPITKIFDKLKIPYQQAHSQTERVGELMKNADIIISAVGKPNVILPENLKKGVVLIGVGIHRGEDGRLKGDYDEEKIKDIAGFYTPTPGGVGPVTVACLISNLIKAVIMSATFKKK